MATFPAGKNSLDGMPSRYEMICLYLYDSLTPPPAGTLKTGQDVMNYKTGRRQDLIIDAGWYMTKGGGRFVDVESFLMVRKFLSKNDTLAIPPKGTILKYDPIQLANAYNPYRPDPRRPPLLGLRHYDYGTSARDYVHRCEVFGSASFRLHPDTRFVITDTGWREIHNACVLPQPDNYDFESDDWRAWVHNAVIQDFIDPWEIGHRVEIKFDGAVSPRAVIDETQAADVEKRFQALSARKNPIDYATAVLLLQEKRIRVKEKNILYWKKGIIDMSVVASTKSLELGEVPRDA
jgi:hypothetical protein